MSRRCSFLTFAILMCLASLARPQATTSVPIPAGVAAGMLLQKVAPVYPPIAKAMGLSGTVVLHATISVNGSIEDLNVVSGPAMLAQAAQDAVSKWVYTPYLVNGQPVPVDTTINVIFALGDKTNAVPPVMPTPTSTAQQQGANEVKLGEQAGRTLNFTEASNEHTHAAQENNSQAIAKSATATPGLTAHGLYTQTLAALLLDRDQEKAAKGFLHVVQIDPHFVAAWFNLGVIAESGKSWAQAETYFRKYLAYAPDGPDAQRAKDQLAILPQYASGTITPVAARKAQYEALVQRARVFLAAGHFREAIAEAGRAQAIDSTRWESYAVVSLCMAKQNKTQDAEQFASRAVQLAPADKRDQVRLALSSGVGIAHQ